MSGLVWDENDVIFGLTRRQQALSDHNTAPVSIVSRLSSCSSSILSLGKLWLDSEVEGFSSVDSLPRPGHVGHAFLLIEAQVSLNVVRVRLPLAMVVDNPPGKQEASEEQPQSTDSDHGVV